MAVFGTVVREVVEQKPLSERMFSRCVNSRCQLFCYLSGKSFKQTWDFGGDRWCKICRKLCDIWSKTLYHTLFWLGQWVSDNIECSVSSEIPNFRNNKNGVFQKSTKMHPSGTSETGVCYIKMSLRHPCGKPCPFNVLQSPHPILGNVVLTGDSNELSPLTLLDPPLGDIDTHVIGLTLRGPMLFCCA